MREKAYACDNDWIYSNINKVVKVKSAILNVVVTYCWHFEGRDLCGISKAIKYGCQHLRWMSSFLLFLTYATFSRVLM